MLDCDIIYFTEEVKMDLRKNGKLLRSLRLEKGLTQKQIADALGIVPKTVSKWETGHGFPDVSLITELSKILGVTEQSLLVGYLSQNKKQSGNMKRSKFYVCSQCGSQMQGLGECKVICCGKELLPLKPSAVDEQHKPLITNLENDFYIIFSHEMTKDHYIQFLTYLGIDNSITVRLYPEQECAVRIPKSYSGKIVYYCNKHGLFEHIIHTNKK